MQLIQIILDDAPENIHIPNSLRHQKVEVTFRVLDTEDTSTTPHRDDDIESMCGILQASHTVSLEQMDKAVKQRGGSL